MQEPRKHTRNTAGEPGRRFDASRRAVRVRDDVYTVRRQPQESRKEQAPVHTQSMTKHPKVQRTVASKPAHRTKRSMVLRRQMVERAKEQQVKTKKKRNLHVLWYLLALLIIGALLTVIWSFREVLPFNIEFFKSQPTTTTTNRPVTVESSTLDEVVVPQAEIDSNIVAPDAPKTLRIPAINVTARIKQVGTTLSGEPIAPKNIYDVGWYEGSSKPGNDGAVLLNGHLAGPTKTGVFNDVQTLKAGDQIIVERGDGQKLTYVVERLQEYTGGQIDMSAAISSVDPVKKGLNLVTTLNKFSGTEKRFIIFALQQGVN